MEDSKRGPRRCHAAELEFPVLRECAEPDASVAQVALMHGLNANLMHKRRGQAPRVGETPAREVAAFIPLALTPTPLESSSPPGDIHVELRRGTMMVNVTWPVASAAHCAAWMREVLK